MFSRIFRLFRVVRRDKRLGLTLLLAVTGLALLGNTLTFYFFERLSDRDPPASIFDSIWYSLISITTIGYGDLSAVSVGARLGTIIFIVLLGLTAFTAAVGLLLDWVMDLQYKERAGMGTANSKNHLLIVNFPNAARVRQIIEEFTQDTQHKKDDIVIVTDQIESLPFTQPNVSFVRGSPLEQETYMRANVKEISQAIVLSTSYDDSNSDSVVASAVSIIEHLNPEAKTVAECLSEKHAVLFAGAQRVSLVYTLRLANNLLVQEAQDPGVNQLTQAITSNQIDGTLASTKVEDTVDVSRPYVDIAKELLDKDINVMGVIRDGVVHVNFRDLGLQREDSLVYISTERHSWELIRSYLTTGS